MFHFTPFRFQACAWVTRLNGTPGSPLRRSDGALPPPGFPIRTPTDRGPLSGSPWHIAARSVLLRLSEPRHPPSTLSSLFPHLCNFLWPGG